MKNGMLKHPVLFLKTPPFINHSLSKRIEERYLYSPANTTTLFNSLSLNIWSVAP